MKISKHMWFFSLLYFILGLFNILFAWLGMLCFVIPLILSIVMGEKIYCNKYCGRGQLLNILGNKFKLSRKKDIPNFIKSKFFRYGFLIFFMIMFFNMLASTYFVFAGTKNLKEAVTILWTFSFAWNYEGNVSNAWLIQFAFGFYSIMLTSTILGIVTMILYKPRSWCVYCPMGTMTQLICKQKNKK